MKDINSEDTLQFNPPTIQIGNQLWMAENLAYDDGGAGITYNLDNEEYYYTWDAAMRVAKKLGWKLPSAEDWNKAAEECGDICTNPKVDDIGYREYVGENLKSKLKVKLAGFLDESFCYVGYAAYFWTSYELSKNIACNRSFYTSASIGSFNSYKNIKYSVRLIKEI